MQLFLDSADPADWRRLLPLGFFHGVTTNPLLLERAGQPCTVTNLRTLAGEARDLGAREIQMQTWGRNLEQMVETGGKLAEIAGPDLTVVVKVPATAEGFQVARTLLGYGHSVTLTAVYTPGQVMAAAGLGAAYAAPYLGRLDDAGQDGVTTILTMHNILSGTGSQTRLLTASLRTAEQVVDLAAKGLDTFTFGPAVADQLLVSDLTAAADADFQRAAEAMGEES
ncbi:MAG: transaldolase [Candidatus Krumholzibacteria bacterium]|nr:transaldolase [Candidatus Krumholzibacteria bacterium]